MSVQIIEGDCLASLAQLPADHFHCCVTSPPYFGQPVPCRVLDPFGGAGTTGLVADRMQRHATLLEINPTFAELARERIRADMPLLAQAS